jgi:hypothetical protein
MVDHSDASKSPLEMANSTAEESLLGVSQAAAADCSCTMQPAAAAARPAGPAATAADWHQTPAVEPGAAERLLCSAAAAITEHGQQQYLRLLAGITLQLADLEGPKRGLALSQDEPLLQFYKQGLEAAVQEKGPNARVLVLSHGGGGVLGLLAAAAGAGSVVVVEKGRWGCRAAQQLLEVNKQQQPDLVRKVQLAPVPLSRCRCSRRMYSSNSSDDREDTTAAAAAARAEGQVEELAGNCTADAEVDAVVHVVSPEQHQQQQQQRQGGCVGSRSSTGKAVDSDCFCLGHQADIVVTDLMDYRWAGAALACSLIQSVSWCHNALL